MPDITTVRNDPTVESWLKTRDVKFEAATSFKIDEIDEQTSQSNQARAEGLERDVLERYVTAMRGGDLFPPIVAYQRGKKLVIVDGNHRATASRKAGAKTIWVYVIDGKTPSETIELLTAEANVRHGQPTDAAWRRHQAVYLLGLGHPADVVASALGVTKSAVYGARTAHAAGDRAARMGIKGWDTIKETAKERLSSIKSDPVFEAMVSTVAETDWAPGAELSKFIRDVNNAASEAEQLEMVQEARERRAFDKAQTKGRNRISNPKQQVLMSLGSVLAMDSKQLRRLFITDDERREIARRLGDASLKLMECEEALRDA